MNFDAHEYTAVMSHLDKRALADRGRGAEIAIANLRRDVSVAGVSEQMEAFFVLAALALAWPPTKLACHAPRNVRGVEGGPNQEGSVVSVTMA